MVLPGSEPAVKLIRLTGQVPRGAVLPKSLCSEGERLRELWI